MYYKVINKMFVKYNKIISTKNENYGKYLQNITKQQLEMFELIAKLDEKLNFGVDLYHSIWNNLARFGGKYIDIIEEYDENPILLSVLLQNKKHTNKIYKNQIFNIITKIKNTLVGVNYDQQWSVPQPLWNGTRFWEYLFERVRVTNFKDKVSRLDSYFLFKSIDDCKCYMETRNITDDIVKVEIIEAENIFEYDMMFMENIENHYTIKMINENINKYWNKEFTSNPLIEVLLNGKFKIVK